MGHRHTHKYIHAKSDWDASGIINSFVNMHRLMHGDIGTQQEAQINSHTCTHMNTHSQGIVRYYGTQTRVQLYKESGTHQMAQPMRQLCRITSRGDFINLHVRTHLRGLILRGMELCKTRKLFQDTHWFQHILLLRCFF